MPIEGRDILIAGGALAGGAVVGALLGNIFGGAPVVEGGPYVELASRRYRSTTKRGLDIEASIVADFDKDALGVRVFGPVDGLAEGVADETFGNVAEAAEFVEKWAKDNDFEPTGRWRTDVLEDVASAAAQPAVAGRHRRRR